MTTPDPDKDQHQDVARKDHDQEVQKNQITLTDPDLITDRNLGQ